MTRQMPKIKVSALLCIAGVLAACAKEPPPARTVAEFLDNPILLEATMVRCAQDRSKTKYEVECVNAREAANRLATAEEEARRIELEKQSERKRRALRRTQEAKAEARRRAEEARRRREEAEYLGIYEELPDQPGELAPPAGVSAANPGDVMDSNMDGNQPGMSVAEPVEDEPVASDLPTTEATDIDAIREELKRRQDGSGG